MDRVWPPQRLTSFLPITLKALVFTPQVLQHSYSTLHASSEGFISGTNVLLTRSCTHARSWPTLCNPSDYSLPGSSIHGIFPASGLHFPPSGDLPDPGTEPTSPALAGGFFTTSTSWEALSRVPLPLKPLGEDPSLSLPASSLSLPRCSSAYGTIPSRSASIFLRPSSPRVSCIQISLFFKKMFIYLFGHTRSW